MKRFQRSFAALKRPLAAVAIVALVFAVLGAQDGDSVKIGIVDVDQALNSTEEGKAAREEFSRKKREAESDVEPMVGRLRNLQEELKSKRYVLSDEALFDKQVEMAELQNKIDNKIKELEGQLKIEQGKMIAPLEKKLGDIIEAIGKENGFTLILQRNSGAVLYTRETLDITDMVVERFNKKS
jgi:outer membrane protein